MQTQNENCVRRNHKNEERSLKPCPTCKKKKKAQETPGTFPQTKTDSPRAKTTKNPMEGRLMAMQSEVYEQDGTLYSHSNAEVQSTGHVLEIYAWNKINF